MLATLFVFALTSHPTALNPHGVQQDDSRWMSSLKYDGCQSSIETFKGLRAVHVVLDADRAMNASGVALIPGSDFGDGTIEFDIATTPVEGADNSVRGFAGVAFRAESDFSKYECLYLRGTNGRAMDQLRRNHAVQYVSYPDFSFARLREKSPGVYESYADMQVNEWMHVKIEVHDVQALLYFGGASQPSLVVNDLKLGKRRGQIGLWVGVNSEAYYANLKFTSAKS